MHPLLPGGPDGAGGPDGLDSPGGPGRAVRPARAVVRAGATHAYEGRHGQLPRPLTRCGRRLGFVHTPIVALSARHRSSAVAPPPRLTRRRSPAVGPAGAHPAPAVPATTLRE
ncbi:hypothetical protein ACF059_04550 [Streptomyces sp. NPDC016562]|uniref:hypothetical protein n=1 Tax=Streptomyces sp. NPDC016562 TaxID=3364966 RepID=UPI0036FB95E4